MNNNHWNSPQGPGNQAPTSNGGPRTGSLMRDYTSPPQTPQQPYANGSRGPATVFPSQQSWPSPPAQRSPASPPMVQQQSPAGLPQMSPANGGFPPSFFAQAMNTVLRWSGKFAAARMPQAVDPNPLVLYKPPIPPQQRTQTRRVPWKRSRALRISMQMRRRRARWQRSGPSPMKVWSIVGVVVTLLVVVLLSSTAGVAFAFYQSQLPALQNIANQQVEQSTRIYDRNGKLLYVAYDGKFGRSTPVSYNYIPGVMQDAMIAAEDETFWTNTGIDPQGILRAATKNASSGTIQGGGSTITQQLIKNMTGNAQDTIQRKLSEAALAIGLTQQYPKWKILEMYFNAAPFGSQDLGVDAAAEDFFGLKPRCDANFNCIPALAFLDRDLTSCSNHNDESTCKEDPILALARATILASVPNDPPFYDPTLGPTNQQNLRARQDYVLSRMLALGMNVNLGLGDQTKNSISPSTQQVINQVEALTKKMKFVGFHYMKKAPHFIDWIIPQIENALGNGDEQLGAKIFLTGGFNIRTTLDLDLETYVENAVNRHLNQPEYQWFLTTYPYGPLSQYHNVHDSSVVVMNAHDGEVLAMDGSANYNDSTLQVAGNYNMAVLPRSPGSSIKPIVYATTFQMGWYPGIVLPDVQTFFPNGNNQTADVHTDAGSYHPTDYGAHYNNKNWNIALEIANSFNVPAVKALEYAGLENVVDMAQRLGITTINMKNAVPSMALGTLPVPLIQMVGAYQAFANQGWRVPPQYVLDIWDNYGHHLYHYDTAHPPKVLVLSPQIAYLITSMLIDEYARAYEFEGDHVLSMWDWFLSDGTHPQVAAKTGTTDSFKDNWTIGYTSDVVVGVWSGNANDEAMDQHVVGITGAAPIWHDVIERVSGRCNDDQIPCGNIHTIFPPHPFPVPTGVIQQSVNTVNGLAGAGYVSWMLEGDVPQQTGFTKSQNGGNNPNATPTP